MSCVLELSRITYTYPDGTAALREVSLHVAHGEKVALVGPNGAGKSTLLLHLNGILTPSSGTVAVSDETLSEQNLKEARASVGLVFQNPDDQLFSPTVFDDVAFGPIYQGLDEQTVRTRVSEALALVHMENYIHRISHHLSMGEKKRIALASVLVMQPAILVLDEPTAGLDPRARRSLIRLLSELPISMVIATHDLQMVRELLPRTVVMDGGRICADGPTASILEDPELLAQHGLIA